MIEIPSADLIRPTKQAYSVKSFGPHEYGCLMGALPPGLKKAITDWSINNILEEHLGPGGRELDPHFTIKYGFSEESPEQLQAIRDLLDGPFKVKLGGFSWFEGPNEDGCPLYVEAESAELRRLHDIIGDSFLCPGDKHLDYVPHLCVAYVDPEMAEYYASLQAEFLGTECLVQECVWANQDGSRESIPLLFLGGTFKKSKGTCEQGQTAEQTGCTPASGEGGRKPEDSAKDDPESAASRILEAAVPIPIPGSQPATIAVSLLVAEVLRAMGRIGGKAMEGELSEDEIKQAVEEWTGELAEMARRELGNGRNPESPKVRPSPFRGRKSFSLQRKGLDEDRIVALGEWLAEHNNPAPMPGYGQIFVQYDSGRIWYVGGDGDEDGFGDLVEEKLSSVSGVIDVSRESEGFPPKDRGWIQVYPKKREWTKDLSAMSELSGGGLVPPPKQGRAIGLFRNNRINRWLAGKPMKILSVAGKGSGD